MLNQLSHTGQGPNSLILNLTSLFYFSSKHLSPSDMQYILLIGFLSFSYQNINLFTACLQPKVCGTQQVLNEYPTKE